MEREKGFDRLIDVWARVVDKAPDWRLRILGDGRERANIEEQIRVAGLGEHVSLPGMTPYEDVLRAMSSASLYALPSRSEGFGIVLIEAAALGLPLIAFDVRTGPRSIIRDGVNGYLIRDGDINGFAERMLALIDDSDKRRAMSAAAIDSVQRFSEHAVMERWLDLFRLADAAR